MAEVRERGESLETRLKLRRGERDAANAKLKAVGEALAWLVLADEDSDQTLFLYGLRRTIETDEEMVVALLEAHGKAGT